MLDKTIGDSAEFIEQGIVLYPTALRLDVIFGSPKFLASVLDDKKYYTDDEADFNRLDEVEDNESVESCDGATWEYRTNTPLDQSDVYKIIMWVRDSNSVSAVMHELIHVTWAVYKYSGIRMDVESQEFQAYLMSYLSHTVLNLIYDNKPKSLNNT